MSSDRLRDECAALVSSDEGLYDATTQALLERYVVAQLSEGTYDFVANKALLKIYQYQASGPDALKPDVTAEVLVLSLMRLPSTDFLALSYLLPGKLAANAKIKQIQKCADYLERAKYQEFWAEYTSSAQPLFASAVGFEQAIRQFIISCVSDAFRNMQKPLLMQLLGFESDSSNADAFFAACPLVENVTGDVVSFSPNEANQAKGINDSTVQLTSMLKLLEAVRGV